MPHAGLCDLRHCRRRLRKGTLRPVGMGQWGRGRVSSGHEDACAVANKGHHPRPWHGQRAGALQRPIGFVGSRSSSITPHGRAHRSRDPDARPRTGAGGSMKKYWSSFLFALALGFGSASSAHAGIATTDFTESWRQASMGDAAALDRLTQAARQGDAAAQRGLGFLYEQGLGVAKDIPQAEGWFRKAAEQDDVAAQVMLGWTCWFDPEARRDYDRAKFWLLK